MKNILFLFSLSSIISLLGKAPSFQLTSDFWNNPTFVKSFMGDYGFRSEVEPRISKSESFILREVIAKSENNLEEAIVYLEEKIEDDSSAALDFALGTMYYQSNRLTRSAQAYSQAIEKFPSFLRAHKNLGLVNVSLENLEPATKHLAKAISLGENDGSTFIALGYCHLSLNRLVSAENAYRMGLLLFPGSKDGLNGLINCLDQAGRYEEALSLLDELLESDPQNSRYLQARASVLGSLGNEKEAAVTLDLLRRMGELKTLELVILGDLYHNLNLYDLSLDAYVGALARANKLSLSQYIRIAQTLIQRSSYQEGFSYLEKIEKEFGDGRSKEERKLINLLKAEVLQATGKNKEATDLLTEIVSEHPLEGRALIQLGQLAWKARNLEYAIIQFKRASKIDEFENPALIEHARLLVSMRKYNDAASLLERALSLKPEKRVEKYLKAINNLALSARKKL
ncbi:MAG: tetratricopeptide repeat protein [Verrucomicrobiota bacterium]|nr:tetratricopeptide repeat protein [Verrucomicrobiota bacterium]